MYFLVKNIHPCSRQIQLKKLYKNGHLNVNYLNKYMSHFIVHPEKLKQVIKEKDAHMLCQFFDSEEYKRRVTEFLEMQSRILSTNTFVGVKPSNIKYQHVLSCAQPSYQAAKTLIDGNIKEESTPKEQNTRKKKFRKGTIFDQILMTKANKEEFRTQITKSSSKRLPPKKVTHRTTIMPIFLKKIKNKPQHSINVEEYLDENTILSENVKETLPESAKKHNFALEVNREPMYAQILHRSGMYKKKNNKKYTDGQEKKVDVQKKLPKTQSVARNDKKTLSRYSPSKSEPVDVEERSVNQTFERNPPRLSNSNNPSTKISGATSKFQSPTLKLYPKKNMNLKSYSQLLLTEPVKCKTSKRERFRPFDLEGNQTKIQILKKKEPPPKKVITLMELVHDTQKNKRLEWEQGMEQKNAVKLAKRHAMKKSRYNDLELLPLFRQMKTIGEPKEQTEGKLNTKEDVLRDIDLTDSKVPKPTKDKQSFTYKMVTKCRNNINSNLKQKFNINTPFWKKSLSETPFGQDALDLKMAIETSNMVSKNITECLHKPIPHFVQFAKRPSSKRMQQCFGFHKYLLRLPKTTPEGYRVLMYAVRDPDPTKMNFNDVVKGFCMYNDCVLSEDGLQEGYVIIFDMKDVSIGHLARVSLPALKCFLWYIQDAHPARIKSIHVLNTATWIHHVMRLVVPLVRSELLNLVKFHKGGLPEKFPTELLPMDYGGEAPTVEELDRTTKALLDKYSSWLIESSLLVADESKRPKKGSWWGLFSSKSNQQVEIDEKNILKNLQID